MAAVCGACRNQVLLPLAKSLPNPTSRSIRPNGTLALGCRRRRQFHADVARLHPSSVPRRLEHVATPISRETEDTYVPFEAAPADKEPTLSHVNPPMTTPFAPPPLPASHAPPETPAEQDVQKSFEVFEPAIEVDEENIRDPYRSRRASSHGVVPTEQLSRRSISAVDLSEQLERPHQTPSHPARPAEASSTRPRSSGLHARQNNEQSNADAAATKKSRRAVGRAEPWQTYKDGIKNKLGDARWNPRKKVSPDAMEGIRAMHAQYPDHFTTPVLAQHFGLSPDAIRRILKSKWRPSTEEEEERKQRWDKRGERIWTNLVEQGLHPPKRWRAMGIGGGPRRPGQDRQLQRAIREGGAAGVGTRDVVEGDAWLRSLSERMG